MVSVQKIWHHNQFQIGISFGFDDSLKAKARAIGARWSQTYKCWYVAYDKESYQKITSTFPHIQILHHSPQPATPAPGLENGHDNAHIANCKHSSALQPLKEVEHKVAKFVKDKMNSGKRNTNSKTRHNLGKGVAWIQSPLDRLVDEARKHENDKNIKK